VALLAQPGHHGDQQRERLGLQPAQQRGRLHVALDRDLHRGAVQGYGLAGTAAAAGRGLAGRERAGRAGSAPADRAAGGHGVPLGDGQRAGVPGPGVSQAADGRAVGGGQREGGDRRGGEHGGDCGQDEGVDAAACDDEHGDSCL
jgi:hypothetical protein